MTTDGQLDDLIAGGDLDELLRELDRRCDGQDWAGVARLRERARAAIERGHQLWPAASHAEYRLALDAPGEWAGAMVVEGNGWFALGPLAEVAAQHHPWDELAPHVPDGPLRSVCAHERVLRGEDLHTDESIDRLVIDLPLVIADWEPTYALASYHPDRADFPIEIESGAWLPVPTPGRSDEIPTTSDATAALAELCPTWRDQSDGAIRVAEVEGDAATAVGALGYERCELSPCSSLDGMGLLAWAAGNGGQHGRRPGMARGRFAAWWCGAALAGMLDDWPIEPARLGASLAELHWFRWRTEPALGHELRLVVEDPLDGLAWSIEALDPAR